MQPLFHVFAGKEVPTPLTDTALKQASKWIIPRVTGLTRSTGNDNLDAQIWAETMEEQAAGLLEGLFTQRDLTAEFVDGWVPARRFGLSTTVGGVLKLRLIDGYSLPN